MGLEIVWHLQLFVSNECNAIQCAHLFDECHFVDHADMCNRGCICIYLHASLQLLQVAVIRMSSILRSKALQQLHAHAVKQLLFVGCAEHAPEAI